MGSSGSSPRQISVKNEDFNLPPIQITRKVLNRLQEHASRPPVLETPSSDDKSQFSDSNSNSKDFLPKGNQENDPLVAMNSTISPPAAMFSTVSPQVAMNSISPPAAINSTSPVVMNSTSPPDDYFPFKSDTNSMDPLVDYKDNWDRYVAKPDYVVIGVGRSGLPTIETVTAVQVRQEMQDELLSNDLFWSSKIQKLMDRYTAAVDFAHEEFSKKVAEIRKTLPILRSPNGCQALKTMLGHCYDQNQKQTLKCSDIVKQFTRCVECEVAAGSTNAVEPKNQNPTVKKTINKGVKCSEQ